MRASRTDAELRDTMIKVEESIDAGKLRMKPEVGADTDRRESSACATGSKCWQRAALLQKTAVTPRAGATGVLAQCEKTTQPLLQCACLLMCGCACMCVCRLC